MDPGIEEHLKDAVITEEAVKLDMKPAIEEHLKDTVVTEGSSAVFECKVKGYQPTAVWYKDGRQITDDLRVLIVDDYKYKRLQLETVTEADSGLYTVLLKNSYGTIFSKAYLQVGPKNIQSIYTCSYPKQVLSTKKKLSNVIVHTGQRMDLEVQFQCEITEFKWYKNHEVLTHNERTLISVISNSSVFSIHSARTADTGIYTVVAKTKFGITSSSAYVEVVEKDLQHIETPVIEEILPEEAEVNEYEDLIIICKARYDSNTIINWFKSHDLIECKERFEAEEYGGRYVGLKIKQTFLEDSAQYSVTLENMITGHTDSSSCFVTVNPSPMPDPPIILLNRPMVSTVSCCGGQVSYDCSFELDDRRYYYVIWYVGHFRIERSNSRFDVVCKDGVFLLHIRKLEPCMAGKVTCELRLALPKQRSVFINSESAYLAIVPPSVLRNEAKMFPVRQPAHYIQCMELEASSTASGNTHLNNSNENERVEKCLPNEVLMEIQYCRLEEDSYCYLNVSKKSELMSLVPVSVRKKQADASKTNWDKNVLVEWTDLHIHMWYAIDLKHDDFIEAGVTSSPSFEIRDPPIGKTLEFRVRTAEPHGTENQALISIAPTSPSGPKPVCPLRDMKEFESCFTNTGDVIGCGAFGSVALVQDTRGEFYAAKYLKTTTQKKRDSAQREYDMIKALTHPKLVELIGVFVSNDSFVLVMEFLWGGELFDRIVQEVHIQETDVVPYVRQICEALDYLHHLNIAHLDLKPENIICHSPNSRQIKIVDFGIAKVLKKGHTMRGIYGTLDYVAPEVLNYEPLTLACDMWSLGVVTYILLSGVMPFFGESKLEKSVNITKANYNYDETYFKDVSDLALDFVDHLLILDPEKRMSPSTALNHKWIVEGPPKGVGRDMKRLRDNLKSYLANYRAKWQRAGNVVIAAHRLRKQPQQLVSLSHCDLDQIQARLQPYTPTGSA